MVTAIVRFPIPDDVSPAGCAAAFRATAEGFVDVPGLIRKYSLTNADASEAVSVDLWETREQAEAFYDEHYRRSVRAASGGADATITIYDTAVVVDNAAGEVTPGESE